MNQFLEREITNWINQFPSQTTSKYDHGFYTSPVCACSTQISWVWSWDEYSMLIPMSTIMSTQASDKTTMMTISFNNICFLRLWQISLIIEGLPLLCNSHYHTKLLWRNNVNISRGKTAVNNFVLICIQNLVGPEINEGRCSETSEGINLKTWTWELFSWIVFVLTGTSIKLF